MNQSVSVKVKVPDHYECLYLLVPSTDSLEPKWRNCIKRKKAKYN